MKWWCSFIESFTPKIIYKPGITNVVADALYRIKLNIKRLSTTKHNGRNSLNIRRLPLSYPITFNKIFLQDVENNEDKAIIIEETHSRAHRGHYWPKFENVQNSTILVVKEIPNKLNIENKVMELLQQFPHAKVIMNDNVPSFTSAQFKSFAQRIWFNSTFRRPRHSTSNG